MTENIPWQIKVELIAEPSISATVDWATKFDVVAITIAGSCWMDLIIEFLPEDRIPDDESEANRIHRVASRYWLSADRNVWRPCRSVWRPCRRAFIGTPGHDTGILVVEDAK